MKVTKKDLKQGAQFFDITFTKSEADEQREIVINELVKTVKLKGFRAGKAPKAMASAHINPDKLADGLLNQLLMTALQDIYKNHELRIIGRPKMEDLKVDDKTGDWHINISFPIYPDIKLSTYESKIKKLKKDKKSETDRINEICDTLLKTIDFPVAESLIETEVNYSLNRLSEQAKNLNLTLEQYLQAIKKTPEEIKKDYQSKATESIKLDIILMEIAKIQSITTSDEEVAQAVPNQELSTQQIQEFKPVLNRRKTIEYLLKI
jgi:FKBP-type peptidyl-prolyl cis-trans isomerase (trigger factor)